MGNEKHLTVGINGMTKDKFFYICDAEGKSANEVVLSLVYKSIKKHEERNDDIPQQSK